MDQVRSCSRIQHSADVVCGEFGGCSWDVHCASCALALRVRTRGLGLLVKARTYCTYGTYIQYIHTPHSQQDLKQFGLIHL